MIPRLGTSKLVRGPTRAAVAAAATAGRPVSLGISIETNSASPISPMCGRDGSTGPSSTPSATDDVQMPSSSSPKCIQYRRNPARSAISAGRPIAATKDPSMMKWIPSQRNHHGWSRNAGSRAAP